MALQHLRFAYADPPYLGMCSYYQHNHGGPVIPDGGCWDNLETHRRLIDRLSTSWPDGWALSLASTNLRDILPLCPPDVRVASWVKPFASWKPTQRVPYTWEPVIFRGGRSRADSDADATRDHLSCSITLKAGFVGAKPPEFSRWLLGLWGVEPGDEVDDLFTGSGGVARAWAAARSQAVLAL